MARGETRHGSLDESLLRLVALMHHAGRLHRDVWRRFDRALHAERRRPAEAQTA